MFVHNAQYYLSLFARRPRGTRLSDHQLEGWEHFHEALASGRGCILVSPHLGDINYYAELFVASGLPVNVVVEDLRPAALSDLVVTQRKRRGVGVIVGSGGALKEVQEALNRNEIVAFISDRDLLGNGITVEFFGRTAVMPGIAFTLASRRKTPVVLGSAVRLPSGTVVADVRPPYVPDRDVRANVQAMARVFEEFIRRFPDYWLAFQPIYRPSSNRSGPDSDPARHQPASGFAAGMDRRRRATRSSRAGAWPAKGLGRLARPGDPSSPQRHERRHEPPAASESRA